MPESKLLYPIPKLETSLDKATQFLPLFYLLASCTAEGMLPYFFSGRAHVPLTAAWQTEIQQVKLFPPLNGAGE